MARILLETDRLVLREMTEADASPVLRLNGNHNVLRYVGEPALRTEAEALEILRSRIFPQYRDHGVGRWAVCLRRSNEFIGWCGLKYLPETEEYDLGYRLLETHWGQGYAFEAARAVLDWGRRTLPGARIVGQARIENLASIRILEKLGLRREKTAEGCGGTTAVYVLGA